MLPEPVAVKPVILPVVLAVHVNEEFATEEAGMIDAVAPEQIASNVVELVTDGIALTVTTTVPAGEVHPATVSVKEYVPDIAVVAFAILGFCKAEVNAGGPDHV